MIRTLTAATLLLVAACGRQEAPAPTPANDVAATPAAPAKKAEVPSLAGTWRVAGGSGLSATFSGGKVVLSEGCLRRAWTYKQDRNTVSFASNPGGSSNCGQSPSAALENAFGPLSEANLAVFAKDGRTVSLSGLGGTLQLERR